MRMRNYQNYTKVYQGLLETSWGTGREVTGDTHGSLAGIAFFRLTNEEQLPCC